MKNFFRQIIIINVVLVAFILSYELTDYWYSYLPMIPAIYILFILIENYYDNT